MVFNTSDRRVEHTVQTAELVVNENPDLTQVASEFELLLDYRGHFKDWYGEISIEYKLINALVNFLHLAKISGLEESININSWVSQEPIRNALRLKVKSALYEPRVATD